MNRKNILKIFKLILMIAVIIICIGIIIYLLPVMKNLSTTEGQEAFKNQVASSGLVGMLSLFGLQLAQIFLIIIPGEPIEILAGMCYGAFWGTIFILISAFINLGITIFSFGNDNLNKIMKKSLFVLMFEVFILNYFLAFGVETGGFLGFLSLIGIYYIYLDKNILFSYNSSNSSD